MKPSTDLMTAQVIADTILEGFQSYLDDFRSITGRARMRYEAQDWAGIQSDIRERLSIYKNQAYRVNNSVRRLLVDQEDEVAVLRAAKNEYAIKARHLPEFEIAETFYNSVCRKVLGDLGADSEMMFVTREHRRRLFKKAATLFRRYPANIPGVELWRRILLDLPFERKFEDLDRDAHYLASAFQEEVLYLFEKSEDSRVEVLKVLFFRNKGAYMVGRYRNAEVTIPLIVPFLNHSLGIFADSLLTRSDDVSMIFSFTRSYFLVDTAIPSELVHFLKTVMPLKPYGDLYNSIGFSKHGKTELYRDFLRHLEKSEDKFVIAPGIRGMVMSVFTLPSYPIVFKLIKDNFDPPKTTTRGHVKGKYKLVSRHDRVGRMADTHEFEHFEFPKDRFAPELLTELQEVAPSLLTITEDTVTIAHLYTERRMIPLNLFLETANQEEAEEVIDEYGNTIKQLAAANIFPGDMLLKNFGVTRHNRVVFYDYDEIGFLTDYNFRRMPEPEDDADMFAPEPWFSVGPNDVFPEEFRQFLVGREDMRDIFFRLHDELFDPAFWIAMQERIKSGEIVDVFPYRRRLRFVNAMR